MLRDIGVSIASLFPYSWGPGGFGRAAAIAKAAGYTGFQILPFRGLDYHECVTSDLKILSFEDAWDYANLWGTILAKLRGKTTPNFRDLLLFKEAETPRFLAGIFSSHEFEPKVPRHQDFVVEIHPELSIDIDVYVEFAEKGGRLCWDTRHVRRKRKDGHMNLDWKELLKQLPEKSVELIHVQPLHNLELAQFLDHQATELDNMLWCLGFKFPAVPAIVEVIPKVGTPSAVADYLSAVRKRAATFLR